MGKSELKLLKNWKRYILEFLMLFLAVFLGFLADGYREKLTEKSREKKYIISLIQDVESDIAHLDQIISNNTFRKSYLDSLSRSCFAFNKQDSSLMQLHFYYPMVLQRPDFFIPNDLTMLQLKNAGGMRLIKNDQVVKAILQYDLQKSLARNQQEYYENYHNTAINSGLKIFDHQKVRAIWNLRQAKDEVKLSQMNFNLLKNSEVMIPQFGNEIAMYSGIVGYYNMLLEESKNQANSLITNLKSAYEIE